MRDVHDLASEIAAPTRQQQRSMGAVTATAFTIFRLHAIMSSGVKNGMKKIIAKQGKISDNRRQRGNIRHKLVDTVFIGLVSVICGGTDSEHMEDTGHGKYERLK